MRLRCGLVPLGHRDGKVTCARNQQCVFCNLKTGHLWAHVFGECPAWPSLRSTACLMRGLSLGTRSWDILFSVVSVRPGDAGYVECVRFVHEVVCAAENIWRGM